MFTVLIIDDEEKLRALLKRIISLEGYNVLEVGSLNAATQLLKKQTVDIMLCDVKLPDGNGVDFTKEIKTQYPAVEVILLTAYGNIPDGVQAIKNGAFDYIVKGDDNDKIIPLLSRAAEKVALQQRVSLLETRLEKKLNFASIIGESPALKKALQLAEKVAPTDTAILLTGETGTGKEVFAQAIHQSSKRALSPFVALNCSTFSKEILESELFGHKAGSFTGASKDKKGLVEEANGGTLFLDEIGEMSPDLQPKLLRLLENGTYIRVGDTKEHKSNIRLIAATNRDLQREIENGQFRNDLYYRIAVFVIELPPLRERIQDIPALADHFLKLYAGKTNKNITAISGDALDALKLCEWKGNVRELKNIIERAVILEDGSELTLRSLPYDIQQEKQDASEQSSFNMSSVEKKHIQKVLSYTNGNKTETARLLNIGLATLYRKIEEYHLK